MNAIKHQKKLLSIVLAIAMIFGIFSIMQMPMSVSAAIGDEFSDNNFTYTVTDDIVSNTVTLKSASNPSGEIVIPAKVSSGGKDYSVTAIDGSAFNGNTGITSVNIPGTVEVIPPSCFAGCSGLSKVTLNDGIKTISANAFQGTPLTEIKFPKSVANVYNQAFANCNSLVTVYVYGNTKFASMAFSQSTTIKDFYLYDSSATVPGAMNFSNVKNVTFHVKEGSTAHQQCQDKGYTFELITEEESTEPTTEAEPDTSNFKWERINDGSAIKINGLKDEYAGSTVQLVIPAEINDTPVTTIGSNAFSANRVITSVEIPSSVTVIEDKAFYDCSMIRTVTIPEDSQLAKIGNQAFGMTSSTGTNPLSEITLPESLKLIGYQAFVNRKSLIKVTVKSKDAIFGDTVKGAEIFDLFEGGSQDSGTPHAPSTFLTIYGHGNSTAEEYALQVGIKFSYLDLDKTALQEAYDKAVAIDGSLYTATSYSNLVSAITQAIRVLKNSGATQVEVNASLAALNEAMDNLVLKDQQGTTAPTDPEPTGTNPQPTGTDPKPTETEPKPTESTPAPVFEEFILGDADYNGIVNVKDVTYIQLHLAKLLNESVNTIYLNNCDVDGDGDVTIKDVTQIQLWLAKFKVEYKIGELVQREVTPGSTDPQNPPATVPGPTTSTDPTTVSDPTGSPEPTTAPVPGDAIRFYVPNAVSWLTDLGGSMWLYNDDTQEFERMLHDEEEDYFYLDIPKDWSNLSIYRTPYETEENQFDITDKRDPDKNPDGVILNYWEKLGSRENNDCYYITADKKGYYTMYESTKGGPVEFMRTIYFDNSTTKWDMVYIYGWNFGLHEDAEVMEHISGTDIWSYTFVTPDLPKNGVEGFLFVSEHGIKDVESSWSGAKQTVDLATETGKDLFVPSGEQDSQRKYKGTWEVYTPAE